MPLLDCKICLREYRTNRKRLTPRILTKCGHTICEQCAQTLLSQNAGVIICPFDREETDAKGSVGNLNKNFAILNYLEEVQEEERTPEIEQPEPIVVREDESSEDEGNEDDELYIIEAQPVDHYFNDADEFDDFDFDMYLRHHNNGHIFFRPRSPNPDQLDFGDNFLPADVIRAFADINLGRGIDE